MPRFRAGSLFLYVVSGLASLNGSGCSDAAERNRGPEPTPSTSGPANGSANTGGANTGSANTGGANTGGAITGNNETTGNLPLQPNGNSSAAPQPPKLERVLVFSRTLGYRHD